MLALGLNILLQVQVPGAHEYRIEDIFKPFATPGVEERSAAYLTLFITGAIFVVVAGLIVYTVFRFRRRADDDSRQEPPQVYGSNQIEAAWTIIPILIVFVLIGVSARVIASVQNASPPKQAVKIRIVGHQWWWEVQYPDYGFVTANEIHMPISSDGSRASYMELTSADVNHAFWIPQLGGKLQLIPNRINYMWLDPSQAGDYVGNCAQYCGTEHAKMLLRVVAQTPADFQAWAAQQQRPSNNDPQVSQARDTFYSLSCVNCHTIRGTPAVGTFAPDLTHLMSRETLGAGVLVNDPKDLRDWVNNPQDAKPGCFMPSMKLSDTELNQVVAYLETLK